MGICAVRLAANTTVCFGRGFFSGLQLWNQPPPELGRASIVAIGQRTLVRFRSSLAQPSARGGARRTTL